MPIGDIKTAEPILKKVGDEVGATGINKDENIVKLSLVGAGMKSSPGIAAKMFRVLADNGVNIEMISTSTIRISVVVERSQLEKAVRALQGFAVVTIIHIPAANVGVVAVENAPSDLTDAAAAVNAAQAVSCTLAATVLTGTTWS